MVALKSWMRVASNLSISDRIVLEQASNSFCSASIRRSNCKKGEGENELYVTYQCTDVTFEDTNLLNHEIIFFPPLPFQSHPRLSAVYQFSLAVDTWWPFLASLVAKLPYFSSWCIF